MTRVLIVDDKPENLYLLRALLQGHGHSVEEARHGAEALVKARQAPPQLVISDLLMPVMDGYTLLRHWKADEQLKAIPFVVYTATYTEPKDERLAIEMGADAFILKPAEPAPFIARIEEVLARAARGELLPFQAPQGEEPVLLKEYSEILVRKLEHKAFELERSNQALQQDIARRETAEAENRRMLVESARSRAALLSIMEDQSEAHTSQREAESRLRLSVAASNIGMWDWNLLTNEVHFSPEWRSQIGYAEDEIANNFDEWQSRLHPDDLAPTMAKLQGFVEDPGVGYAVEFRLRHKDGSWRWIYTQAQILSGASGRPERMIGCHIDITERKQAEQALRENAQRLRALSHKLLDTEEAERRRINRELHDSVGQNLSALNLNLAIIGSRLPEGSKQELAERFEDAHMLIETTARQVRDVMADLHPPALDDYGLLAALRSHAVPFAKRTALAVTVRGKDLEPRPPLSTELALFRIAQEALANAAKHGRARHILLTLAASAHSLRLCIADDGVGFDPQAAGARGAHWGMATMRERAEAIGAALRVRSAPGQGTRVMVQIARAPA